MKIRLLNLLAAASMFFACSAWAAPEPMELLRTNNCLGCHNIEGKKVGPSYMDVAQKYKSDPKAASNLSSKIARGGNGVWGTMPMPANSPRVSAADINVMVSFILSLAK